MDSDSPGWKARSRRFLSRLTRRKVISDDVMSTELSRILTPLAVIMIGIGQMSGGGAFVVLGTAARLAGPGVMLSFAIGGLVAFTTGMCYAEFAATIPRAGSGYLFTYVTLGEFIAFVVGWQVILEELISLSSMSSAISGAIDSIADHAVSNYTMAYVGTFHSPMLAAYPDLLALGIGLVSLVVFLFGVNSSIFTSNVFTGLQLAVIVLCIAAGFAFADFSNWTVEGFLPNGFRGVMEGAASSFYAFIGFEGVACAGEETANPQKTIPMALFTSLGIMVVLYLLQAAALTLMVPFREIDPESAFPEAFAQLGHGVIAGVVALGIVIGLIGGLINGLYSLTRVVYSMSQDGLLFRIFGKINSRTKTPLFAEMFFGALAAALAVVFNVEILVEFLSVGTLIAYTIVSASSIVLHYQHRVTVYDVQRRKSHAIELPDDFEQDMMAGKLKDSFRRFSIAPRPNRYAVDIAVVTFAIFVGAFLSMFSYAYSEIQECIWWALLLVILFGLGFVASYAVIVAHHKRRLRLPFEMPSVPFVPALSMALNILLLVNLSGMTWTRMAIWFSIGLIIYFSYGIRHSLLEKPQSETLSHTQDTDAVDPDVFRDPNMGITDESAVGINEKTPLLSRSASLRSS
ncbi:probable cationic amino acid transporter isoform X2 [Paramacrobiotus metropolitanus]|uniref:probable cationic amino acid transporter isoform X2 n=1 Tax=Paramacrobiotus metropolitanus TaxID=2943436 RepID=UPI002445F9B7|nr:probable cationic amino acid transporter isoform X2 [Paramacrobiotus metropolitanus]